jgi:hypothetical protein
VKYYALLLVAAFATAQSSSTIYTTDLNGHTVADGTSSSNDGKHTQTTRSINGRAVPLEQSDERVISETPSGKVTEKIIRKYDPEGQLAQTTRIVTEEQKRASGSTVNSTTYRSDLNGAMHEDERKTVETNTSGPTTNTQTVISRDTPNGFATVEKRSSVSETATDSTHTDETVYRADANGNFAPAVRTVTDTTQKNGQTVEKAALYEPIADVTKMQLSRQTVTTTTTRADGSSTAQTNYYGPSVPGNVRDPEAAQRLYEQDTVERSTAGGKTTETLTARRVTPNDPTHLGAPITVSETVCTGNCSGK